MAGSSAAPLTSWPSAVGNNFEVIRSDEILGQGKSHLEWFAWTTRYYNEHIQKDQRLGSATEWKSGGSGALGARDFAYIQSRYNEQCGINLQFLRGRAGAWEDVYKKLVAATDKTKENVNQLWPKEDGIAVWIGEASSAAQERSSNFFGEVDKFLNGTKQHKNDIWWCIEEVKEACERKVQELATLVPNPEFAGNHTKEQIGALVEISQTGVLDLTPEEMRKKLSILNIGLPVAGEEPWHFWEWRDSNKISSELQQNASKVLDVFKIDYDARYEEFMNICDRADDRVRAALTKITLVDRSSKLIRTGEI